MVRERDVLLVELLKVLHECDEGQHAVVGHAMVKRGAYAAMQRMPRQVTEARRLHLLEEGLLEREGVRRRAAAIDSERYRHTRARVRLNFVSVKAFGGVDGGVDEPRSTLSIHRRLRDPPLRLEVFKH